MLVAGLNQPARIAALDAAAGFIRIQKLEAEVGKAVVGQRQAQVGGDIHLVAVTVVGLAPTGLERQALGGILQLEVQNAGNSVRAVLGRGPVAQDFDPLQGDGRDNGQVSALRPEIDAVRRQADDRGAVATFAVDEDQGGVGRQPAQIGRPHKSSTLAEGMLVDVIGRHGRRQQRVYVPDAVGLQVLALNNIYRHRRILGRTVRHARADHLQGVQPDDFRFRLLRFGC